uniref:Uncharacterized protein n=1 Tax=Anguilla anguilla TaxID=7936 RepID=A0A0E9WKG0_ANGAN
MHESVSRMLSGCFGIDIKKPLSSKQSQISTQQNVKVLNQLFTWYIRSQYEPG